MIKIAPSLLSADFLRLKEEIIAIEASGADMLHIDIMDGQFVPNITIGPAIVESIRKITNLILDVHLMIVDPDRYLNDFIKAGSDYITVHVEASTHVHRTIQKIKENGVKAGLSLNPATPLCTIDHMLYELDMVLLMSVNPGFGGQKFIPFVLDKIKNLRRTIDEKGLSVLIEVDGGIKISNALEIASVGADILVMGSGFFNAGDYNETINKLREILSYDRQNISANQ